MITTTAAATAALVTREVLAGHEGLAFQAGLTLAQWAPITDLASWAQDCITCREPVLECRCEDAEVREYGVGFSAQVRLPAGVTSCAVYLGPGAARTKADAEAAWAAKVGLRCTVGVSPQTAAVTRAGAAAAEVRKVYVVTYNHQANGACCR